MYWMQDQWGVARRCQWVRGGGVVGEGMWAVGSGTENKRRFRQAIVPMSTTQEQREESHAAASAAAPPNLLPLGSLAPWGDAVVVVAIVVVVRFVVL